MRWMLRLVEVREDARPHSIDLIEITRPDSLHGITGLGLTLSEAKQLLASVQQAVVSAQGDRQATLRPTCRSCGGPCRVKAWRPHQIATLFGGVTLPLRRFVCRRCSRTETGVEWPSHCRSTPELEQLQAHLSALLPYRKASGLLRHLLPVDAGRGPETFRSHTLKVGEQLDQVATTRPASGAAAITVTLDSTFIRSCKPGDRSLEVRIGNVETPDGGRQVFGAVARTDTNVALLIRRSLEAVGGNPDTDLTTFTDGGPGLRSILAEAGARAPPIADWFHIAMRLEHAKQAASGLSTDEPGRMQAKSVIIAEVERLHWRIWNGKAKNARISLDRIRNVMHVFGGEHGQRGAAAPSRRLWTALHEVNGYLTSQSAWLVNYAKRYRAGLRVGTSVAEGTANFLINRRMNKSQQMRWSRRGADLLLQVRCAVFDGVLGSGFGQLFESVPSPGRRLAPAA